MTLKLSDSIMLGSTTGKQIRNHLFDDGDGTCALGAAYRANGIPMGLRDSPRAATVWPWLDRRCVCPVCDESQSEVTLVITNHLNDTHEWTREKIAAWVARIEPQEPKQSTCDATIVQNSEDQYGVLCGKKCEPGKDFCDEHYED